MLSATAVPPVPGALTASEVVARVGASGVASIIGFGSLLSEQSAQSTCPSASRFRLGRVRGWRRVFGHPAHIFFARGIARPDTREIASLCAEPSEDAASGFVVAAFDVPASELPALLEREEEFNFVEVPIYPLGGGASSPPESTGIMCTRATDEEVLDRRGHRAKYEAALSPHFGSVTVWGWGADSGLRPCPVYCRHCVLASQKPGVPKEAADSFLDETLLADRRTTLRQYLQADGGHVMHTLPPPELAARYNG